ncbi:hypothetical protein GC175_06830 [bacterium]|nr:hypothetical protein [bacterium]
MLTITTLGRFDVVLNGVSLLEGNDVKRGLLLLYLAEKRKPQLRLDIARILWPGAEDSVAQVNLRSLLLRLRRDGLDNFISAGRSMVTLSQWHSIHYDVALLRNLTYKPDSMSTAELKSAADLYQGGFLQSVLLDGYAYLDEWASVVRAEMEVRAVQVISMLVAQMISLRDTEDILHQAEHLVTLTPYDDYTQELYIQALAISGRVSDALNHYHQYRRRLREEIQINQVGESLLQLVEELKQPRLDPQLTRIALSTTQAGPTAVETDAPHGTARFPYIEHPVIGRGLESGYLIEQLDNGSRLLTVIGIGGAGKTFFVRSLYEPLHARFGNAIYYTDLRSRVATQQAFNALLLAIATAINLIPKSGKPLLEQVTDALFGRKCCLILDNFETVQPAADRVLDLLKAAPQLTILITSRERLGLHMESVLHLGGLSQKMNGETSSDNARSAADSQSTETHTYETDAVRYFLQCARRQDINYEINDEKRKWIEEICRKVEALPLAIELAAMQINFFSLPELSERIGTDHTVLVGNLADLPGDHYSMWAVLDSMWQTLDDDERRVLAELSVFVGVFQRDAMMSVASAYRSTYTGLINASLLRVEESGWFSLHPLVKRYVARYLAPDAPAYERHALYFLAFLDLGERLRQTDKSAQLPLLEQLLRCHADVVLGWQWAIDRKMWDLLNRVLVSFGNYLTLTLQFEEIARLMQLVLTNLPPFENRTPTQNQLAGKAAIHLGLYSQNKPYTIPWLQQAQRWLEVGGDAWDITIAYIIYAEAALGYCEQWDRAEALLTKASELIEMNHFSSLRVYVHLALGHLYLYQGKWAKLRTVQSEFIDNLQEVTFGTLSYSLLIVALLDDWDAINRLLEIGKRTFSGHAAEPRADVWIGHYRDYLLAQQGDLAQAIAGRNRSVSEYSRYREAFLLPMVHGALAIWHLETGDFAAAQTSAQNANFHARKQMDLIASSFGLLFVAVVRLYSGDTAAATLLLREVLTHGQALRHPVIVFSALYYLAQIQADKLPTALVARIVKIGAVSPVMHFVLRPFARGQLTTSQFEINDDEREPLWSTDGAMVDLLVEEVSRLIPGL